MADNNIAEIRKRRGLSQTDLAESIGTTLNMMGKLERGDRKLDQNWLSRIGRALDVEPAAIISKNLPADTQPTHSVDAGETVNITQLDLSLSMGPGTIIDQWVESEPVTFDLAFIRRITRSPPGRLRLVTGIGRSMEPTLQDGDTVLIDTMDTHLARQDGIYWVSVYGAAGIKRLRATGETTVLVISDNKDVAPQEVAKMDLRIEGRAIWAARGL